MKRLSFAPIILLLLTVISWGGCNPPSGPKIEIGGWEDFPDSPIVGYTDIIYVQVSGTTTDMDSIPLTGTNVLLYYNGEYGDTLRTESDSLGQFEFGKYACSWKYGESFYHKDVHIEAIHRTGTSSVYSGPQAMECKADTQFVALTLDTAG
ncbi:MAG TPA: hypothetical protein VJ905_00895 [Halalkalibaculum sp.]|nr:hypothetical protein [Halalkalibaculum sp.]